jgi:hypothetical protein
MYPRTDYEMTEKDLKVILDACKPTPVLFGNGGQSFGGSQQENANRAWSELGKKMGFDYMTVRPIQDKGMRFFTAIPSETDNQREEREAKEKEDKRLARVVELKKEIADKEKELKELL